MSLSNKEYRVTVNADGGAFSEVLGRKFDLTRRSYDGIDPAGRAFFLVDTDEAPQSQNRFWPVFGNYPKDRFLPARLEKGANALECETRGIRATIDITLPDAGTPAELWTVTLKNLGDKPRHLKAVPYVEWVLDHPESDRGHSQYVRLFPEMEYVSAVNGVLAWQRKTNTVGFLAVDTAPDGFHSSRLDFIGRARSLWNPRLLETLDFLGARDTSGYPTFDPIGALSNGVTLEGGATGTLRYILGFAPDREKALATIPTFLVPLTTVALSGVQKKTRVPLIGHGEIPPGTPQPYSTFMNGSDVLRVHTPFTPRPYDHALSNGVGHYVMVTNRGLHTTSNGNSQQNVITPDWADTVTREVSSEAIYLYDTEERDLYSPTHHPLNDSRATYDCDFGVDGTAVFRMRRGPLSTELTVFVPPRETLGVYLLTIRNHGDKARCLRVSPFFHMALAPGSLTPPPLVIKTEETDHALLFENPANTYRPGPAFASVSFVPECMEIRRGRFLGTGRGPAHPFLVEHGKADETQTTDNQPVAAFMGSVEVPAKGERTVVVVLGQTDTKEQALALVRKYKDIDAARQSLEETRSWWKALMSTVQVKTNQPAFDGFQNWLKYQAVAERIWARRGFYQTSGAYGFRDQLQDAVNLIWVDPALARKQILLHASQQFTEGDVLHWFHTRWDGQTAFSNRTHASDNPLWLVWGAAEYVRMTGDETILDETASYLQGEKPFLPLPQNKHGCGGLYARSSITDTVYKHCMKSIDLVLNQRMGAHGLPLIGTGDWNDGLDEIGSEGRGESVWLGFFLHYNLKNALPFIDKREPENRRDHYRQALRDLEKALELTWRGDRYLRAIHDDGTEIGVKDSGVWEIDALTAAWAVYAGINTERARTVFHTALKVLEKDNVILLGWPPLRNDTKPYLGRSSQYPAGVRENGMYCHGVQWLIRAARLLAEQAEIKKDQAQAKEYRSIAYRLWLKITPVSHVVPSEIEMYGGQPNKQSADMVTTFDPGRMIWHGYTGAAGWLLRQSIEGVIGATLVNNKVILPSDLRAPRGNLVAESLEREVSRSPLNSMRFK